MMLKIEILSRLCECIFIKKNKEKIPAQNNSSTYQLKIPAQNTSLKFETHRRVEATKRMI